MEHDADDLKSRNNADFMKKRILRNGQLLLLREKPYRFKWRMRKVLDDKKAKLNILIKQMRE